MYIVEELNFPCNTRTWNFSLELKGGKFGTDKESMSSDSTVKLWSSPPQDVVMATDLDGFKGQLIEVRGFVEVKPKSGYLLPVVADWYINCWRI